MLAGLAVLALLAARAAAEPAPADDELSVEADTDAELVDEIANNAAAESATDALADLDTLGIGGIAGSEDWFEAQERHQRPSWIGRIDVSITWLHRDNMPALEPAHAFDELWLVATWRR